MAIIPSARPRITQAELLNKLANKGYLNQLQNCPLFVVGIRGYYRDTMGAVGKNDRGIYDDAIFLCADDCFVAFNGNTDPSKFKAGYGEGSTKGMACLNTGLYKVHQWDRDNGKYFALCQRAGKVTVTRDGITSDYECTGKFGINIHKGMDNKTSSEGCQTIPPSQWKEFINLIERKLKDFYGNHWNKTIVPYVLLEA
jgi:hypothetical protein